MHLFVESYGFYRSSYDVDESLTHEKVYIIVGRSLPEGSTVYVMIQELSQFGAPRTTTIWKPSTGEGFDARDTRHVKTF